MSSPLPPDVLLRRRDAHAAFAGDVTCQMLAIEVARREEEQAPSESTDEHINDSDSRQLLSDLGTRDVASEIDWGRTLRFTFVGAAVLAPALHVWYGFLIRKLPGTAPATVVKRVALDQLVFAPVFLAGFLSTVMVLDGKAAKVRVRKIDILSFAAPRSSFFFFSLDGEWKNCGCRRVSSWAECGLVDWD